MEHKITEELITLYREHLVREEYAPDTIKKYMRDIRAFITWLHKEYARKNPQLPGNRDFACESAPQQANSDKSASLTQSVECGEDCCSENSPMDNPSGLWENVIHKENTAGWKAFLSEQGYAPVTVNAMLSSLNSFLGFLGWGGCKVKLLKIQRRIFRDQEKELNREEYGRLLETARAIGNERLVLLLETICATGIRVSEIKYITAETVARKRADISLKGKIRTILLPGKLCKKLMDYAKKRHIATGEMFVTASGNGISRCQIWREMKSLCRKAKVSPSKVFPHNLRHLFARSFYKSCRDIAKLADVLGHSSIETTRIYLISTGETHARQMERLGLIS